MSEDAELQELLNRLDAKIERFNILRGTGTETQQFIALADIEAAARSAQWQMNYVRDHKKA